MATTVQKLPMCVEKEVHDVSEQVMTIQKPNMSFEKKNMAGLGLATIEPIKRST